MKVYICRHGETEGNRDRILQGGGLDFPLTKKGEMQAVELGQSLKDIEFDAVFCSSNQRTKDTLELMGIECSERFFEDRLREQFFGEMAGVCIEDIPAEKNKEYMVDPMNHAHDGGGESFVDMARRGEGFWNELKGMNYECVLLVAHSGTMRGIEGVVSGDLEAGFLKKIGNCEVAVYEV